MGSFSSARALRHSRLLTSGIGVSSPPRTPRWRDMGPTTAKARYCWSEYWWVNVSSPSTHNSNVHAERPRRRRCCNMVRYRGGACLQYRPRSLQRGNTQGAGILRRPGRRGVGRALFRLEQRYTTGRRQVLMANAPRGRYGIGRLDRLNLQGNTQFFQTRLQFEL
jgi:hypothetical protein